jgi:hypothetical protein
VSPQELQTATQLRKKDGGSLGECLVRIGAVEEEELVEFYHKRLMIPRIADAKLLIVSPKVLGMVPADMAAEFRLVPVEVDNEGTITLAMADPSDNHAVDEVAFFADRFVLRAVATESAVRRAIETHYGVRFTSPKAADRASPAQMAQPAARTPDRNKTLPSGPPTGMAKAQRQKIRVAPEPTPEQKKAEVEQQVVLLTKVKRSEETPLPIPIPPPSDYQPQYARDEDPVAEAPILLTKPKPTKKPPGRDTLPGVTVGVPDPPLAQLRETQERDQIASIVLDYLAMMTSRALFFVVKKSLLAGHDARGEKVDAAAVKQLGINIEVPSIFRDVIASRLPYRGPLPETAANKAFAATIGGVSSDVLLMPILVRERIIGVLYADGAFVPLPDAALHATTREAGLAYERLILDSKGR